MQSIDRQNQVVRLAHPGRHHRRHGWHTRPTCKRETLPAATTTLARPHARAGRRQTHAAVPTPPGVASQHTLPHCIHLLLLVQRGSGYGSDTRSLTHAEEVKSRPVLTWRQNTLAQHRSERARPKDSQRSEMRSPADMRTEVSNVPVSSCAR